jgi:hypothetical protein
MRELKRIDDTLENCVDGGYESMKYVYEFEFVSN